MVAAIEIENVGKNYPTGFLGLKRKRVLDGVTLSVPEGMAYGLLGPNGAGKTTLISMVCGLVTPDTGTIKVLGRDAVRETRFVQSRINLCSGNPNFLWSMTVGENLTYYAMIYGLAWRARRARVGKYIDLLELGPYRNTRFDELSTGLKQRLALAKALLTEPEILFLDEPTLGLDPHMAIKMRATIRQIHAERRITIVLTSHYMKEVEEICERTAFLRDGRIAAEGTHDELKKLVEFKIAQPTMEDVFLELIQ